MSHNNNNQASEEDSESCSEEYESELDDNDGNDNDISDEKNHGKESHAKNHCCDKNKSRETNKSCKKKRRKDYYCNCNKESSKNCKSKHRENTSDHSPNSGNGFKKILEYQCNCMTCQESRMDVSYYNRLKSCEGKVDLHQKAGKKCKVVNPVDKTVTKRLASAHRDTINGLKGQINLLEIKIKELQKENSTYKLMQYRQDKALTRYQGEFAELPSLIKNHKEELQSTRQMLKKSENKCRELEETIKVRDKRISKMHDENYKLSSFVNQYDMGNRYKLLMQLKETKAKLKETEKKADESSHYLQVLQRSQQQRMHEDSVKQKSMEVNLYKAHMRNVELQKCVEDQSERLKNYESLILKTIRKNNMPIDTESLNQQNSIQMRNMYSNRPSTYTLQLQQNQYSEITENYCGGQSSYHQQPISYGHATTYFPVQEQHRQPLTAIVERNEDNEPQDTLIPSRVANNTVNANQCSQTQYDGISSSIVNPLQNYPCSFTISNDHKIVESDDAVTNIEKGTQCIEIVSHSGRSGGDRKNSASDENCIKKELSKIHRKKNRYEAGDEASLTYLHTNSENIDEFKRNNCGDDISYNNDTGTEDDKFLQTLRAKKEARRCRRNIRKTQKVDSPTGNSYVKISEEMIEKFVVDANGRRKKSMSIMKKRKNVYHANPANNDNFPVGIESQDISEIDSSYNFQVIPFEAAGDSFVAESPMKSICYSHNVDPIPLPDSTFTDEPHNTNQLALLDTNTTCNNAHSQLLAVVTYGDTNDSKPILKRCSLSR